MKHLEIIELRTTGKNRDALQVFLASWQKEVSADENMPRVTIYKQAVVETDISIHLQYDAPAKAKEVRFVSERLATALKEFGLVNHSTWVEQEYSQSNNKAGKWQT